MINKEGLIGGTIGTIISSTGIGLSLEQLDRILSIVCSITGLLVAIISCIVIPLIRWWKKAKADGKITQEEIEEGKEILNEGIDAVQDSLKDKKGKEK